MPVDLQEALEFAQSDTNARKDGTTGVPQLLKHLTTRSKLSRVSSAVLCRSRVGLNVQACGLVSASQLHLWHSSHVLVFDHLCNAQVCYWKT
jgi:hypothetical protein